MQTATITILPTGDVQIISPMAPITPTFCDSSTALIARARQIIPKIPNYLLAGDHWRDSTTTTGCRGAVPAASTVISNYLVMGDTTFKTLPALRIHRTDSLSADGEGSDGQHRIHITANGTGTADLFLDAGSGRLLGSHAEQITTVNVTTSGRLEQFVQLVREAVTIAGY